VVNNLFTLEKKLLNIKKNNNIFHDKINKLKTERIQNYGNSVFKTKDSIIKLLV
jgi:hypothetical protein